MTQHPEPDPGRIVEDPAYEPTDIDDEGDGPTYWDDSFLDDAANADE